MVSARFRVSMMARNYRIHSVQETHSGSSFLLPDRENAGGAGLPEGNARVGDAGKCEQVFVPTVRRISPLCRKPPPSGRAFQTFHGHTATDGDMQTYVFSPGCFGDRRRYGQCSQSISYLSFFGSSGCPSCFFVTPNFSMPCAVISTLSGTF